jgi:hypothetical protein
MVAPLGRRTVKGFQDVTLFKQSLRESGRCNRSPILMFGVVQEGVGFDRLQTFYYYLKLPPRHIIPCWPDYLPCLQPELPLFCGQVASGASEAYVSPALPCSHECSSNCLQLQLHFLGPACRAVPDGVKPSIPSTLKKFPRVV